MGLGCPSVRTMESPILASARTRLIYPFCVRVIALPSQAKATETFFSSSSYHQYALCISYQAATILGDKRVRFRGLERGDYIGYPCRLYRIHCSSAFAIALNAVFTILSIHTMYSYLKFHLEHGRHLTCYDLKVIEMNTAATNSAALS
jgi:hypothetical protein